MGIKNKAAHNGGIAEALIATACGLGIAIFSLILPAFLLHPAPAERRTGGNIETRISALLRAGKLGWSNVLMKCRQSCSSFLTGALAEVADTVME